LAYLLQQETALLEIAQLLGADTLPPAATGGAADCGAVGWAR
jgi:hypothetical protein